MPAENEKAAVLEAEREAVAPGVDESTATANQSQQSPEDQDLAAGEQGADADTETQGESPAGEPGDTAAGEDGEGEENTSEAKAERKSRTAKRITALREKLSQSQGQIAELQQRLYGQMTAPAQPPAGQSPQAGAQLSQATPQPFESAATDPVAQLAQAYHATDDPVRKQQLAAQYELARQTQLEQRIASNIQRNIHQRESQVKQARFLSRELAELNAVAPLFKPGTTEMDPDSPLMRAGRAAAQQAGESFADAPIHWLQKGAFHLVLQGGLEAQATARKAQTTLRQTMSRAGLESTKRGAPAPTGGNAASQIRKLEQRAAAGDVEAKKQLTRYKLGSLM